MYFYKSLWKQKESSLSEAIIPAGCKQLLNGQNRYQLYEQ